MTSSRGLPPGAQPWGRDVEAALARLKEIEDIARRICNDFGLDFSNPSRGLSTGPTPSVDNPVQLKLPSLNDLDIRDAQDGDLLTFDGKRGKWVARRHDTVQLPKPVPVGDPDSYYTESEPEPVSYTAADTESARKTGVNLFTDPSFETGLNGWAVGNIYPGTTFEVSSSTAKAYAGQSSLKVAMTAGTNPAITTYTSWLTYPTGNLPVGTKSLTFQVWLPAFDSDMNLYIQPEIRFLSGGELVAYGMGSVPRGMAAGWYWGYCDAPYYNGTYDAVELRMNVTLGVNRTVELWFDEFYIGTTYPVEYGVNFNGSTPDSAEFDYFWNGPIDASTSTGLQRRRITAPGTIPAGIPAQVLGAGFAPGETVTLTAKGNTITVTADSAGAFDARLPISETTEPGTGTVQATGSFTNSPTVNVTFE